MDFINGCVAGSIGALAVFPIDVTKTRMQNQNKTKVILYNNSWDCFKKLVRNEGFRGMYKGVLPQMLGVAPEKALKLYTNKYVRENLPFGGLSNEILAGCAGGAAQVGVTNPLEIMKIQYQMNKVKTMQFREVWETVGGFRGIYRGASACFLRDIPFSGIYFPVYFTLKQKTGNNFISGTLAGIPAAFLVTPADVVKTRLQTKVDSVGLYNGLWDCFSKVWKNEGVSALYKGSMMRVIRSSPQFGITLWLYEKLNSL
jgi:solute carrier family 25 aspartate/glutamate transporter 12/13